MSITKLITIASILAGFVVSSRQLPRILHEVRLAKLHLIKEPQTSKWGMPLMFSVSK